MGLAQPAAKHREEQMEGVASGRLAEAAPLQGSGRGGAPVMGLCTICPSFVYQEARCNLAKTQARAHTGRPTLVVDTFTQWQDAGSGLTQAVVPR